MSDPTVTPTHFAPYGSTNAKCGETVPKSMWISAVNGEYEGGRFTVFRARATCAECVRRMGPETVTPTPTDTRQECPGEFVRWSAFGASYPDTVCAYSLIWPEGEHPGAVLCDADNDLRPGDVPCPAHDPEGFAEWADDPTAARRVLAREAGETATPTPTEARQDARETQHGTVVAVRDLADHPGAEEPSITQVTIDFEPTSAFHEGQRVVLPGAVAAQVTLDERVLIQDRDELNAFARTLPPGGWALLILGCGCPAILARVEDGGRACAEIRPVDLSPDDDDSHEHDNQGWLGTRALDYPVVVQHNPAAAPSPAVSAPDLDAIRAEAEHFAHLSDERGHMAGSLLTLLAALAAAHAETERLREAITTGKTSGVMRGALNRAQAERDEARAALAVLREGVEGLADEYATAVPGFVRRLRAALAAAPSETEPVYEVSPGAFMTVEEVIPAAPERCTYPGALVIPDVADGGTA